MRTPAGMLAFALLLTAQPQKLASLLPDAPAFAGKPASAAALYGKDLYKYLDGGAEAYHRRGFVALAHREYRAADIELTADIYDMGSPARALSIYSAERSPESASVKIGREGYAGEGFLNFVAGRYYVKLIAFSDKSRTAPALEAAAKSIAGKIHD